MDLAGVERDGRPTPCPTTRRPSESIPAPLPAPPRHRTGWSQQRVPPSHGLEHDRWVRRQPVLQAPEQTRQRGLDLVRLEAQRPGTTPELTREVALSERHVEPDADNRPTLLGAPLHEDPGDLSPAEQDVVGPLDQRVRTGHVGHGRARQQRQQARRVADDDRAQERAARAVRSMFGPAGPDRPTARRR